MFIIKTDDMADIADEMTTTELLLKTIMSLMDMIDCCLDKEKFTHNIKTKHAAISFKLATMGPICTSVIYRIRSGVDMR